MSPRPGSQRSVPARGVRPRRSTSSPRASSAAASAEPIRPEAPVIRTRSRVTSRYFFSMLVMKARRKSTGTGKMVVELFSVAISARVCR